MGSAERRAEIMRVLGMRRYETISNLAGEFGVSTRTIQRDLDALSISEPIYTQCGRHGGGVYVMENYSMNRTYMTDNEITLLHKLEYFAENKSVCNLEEKELVVLRCIISQYTKPKKERINDDESKRKRAI